jgi:LmbE family N-acetylglucosaminyl deacetylase
MNKKIILAIGAHPDDIEIGCGGTIRSLALEGADIFFIVATLGEKCIVREIEEKLLFKKRKEESVKAAKCLGVKDIFFLGLPDTNIEHNGASVTAIEKYLKQLEPNFIFTHTKEDHHQDHRNLALATISACRRQKINILHYESPSTAQSFLPLVFNDISETINHKIETLGLFTTQNEKIYLDKEAIKGLAKYRGYISGYEYAEGFEISRYYISNS